MFFETFSFFLSKVNCFSAFINTAEGFLQPLSKEEEKKEFDKFRNNNDMQARQNLITHNLRLVVHIVSKYAGGVKVEADDLISAGTIGLMKAIDSFDYSKGFQLGTYASRCIDNEILMVLRSNKKYKETLSLNDVVGGDKDGNELMLMDIIPSEEEEIESVVETNFLIEKVNNKINQLLTKREREILDKRFGLNGKIASTQKEVAEKMNISRSYVSRIEAKAINTIRESLKNHF